MKESTPIEELLARLLREQNSEGAGLPGEPGNKSWSLLGELQHLPHGQPTNKAQSTPGPASVSSSARTLRQGPDIDTMPERPALPSIPGYRLLEPLGRGGMGVVYKAEQQSLNRLVALKMILAGEHSDTQERDRFRREARTIARLQNPGIVQIHEIGQTDPGSGQPCPFMSMELCAGGSLASYLAATRPGIRDSAELIEKLARTMQAAHEASIIHRDLKPGNILLAQPVTPPSSLAEQAKIGDFGLARRLDEPGQSASGEIIGTPGYMAPEQARGDRAIGAQVDVYALGAILYECLTGRPPFRESNHQETLLQVLGADPIAPRLLNPQVPFDLETICLKCLEKDQTRRYRSAVELADDLRRFLDHRPIQARPVGQFELLSRRVARQPVLTGLICFALLTLIVVPPLMVWLNARIEAEHHQSVTADDAREAARMQAEDHRYFARLSNAAQLITAGRAGWTWAAESELVQATRAETGLRDAVTLRSLAVDCMAGVDLRPRKRLREISFGRAVAVDRIGNRFAVGERHSTGWLYISVVVFDARGRKQHILGAGAIRVNQNGKPSPDGATVLVFGPDGKSLFLGTRSGRIHRWDLTSSPPRRTGWKAHGEEVTGAVVSADGRTLYTTSRDRTIKRWDARRANKKPQAVRTMTGTLGHLHWMPGASQLLVGTRGRRLVGINATTLADQTLPGKETPVADRLIAHADSGLLALSRNDKVRLVDGRTGFAHPRLRDRLELDTEDQAVEALAFDPSGSLVASCTKHGLLRLWCVSSGRQLLERSVGDDCLALAFTGDSRGLIVAGQNCTVLYEIGGLTEQTRLLPTGAPVRVLAAGEKDSVFALSRIGFNETGWHAALWSFAVESGKRQRHWSEQLPPGRHPMLMTAGQPGVVRVTSPGRLDWLEQGRRPLGIPAKTAQVEGLAFDGKGEKLWLRAGSEVVAINPRDGKELHRWRNNLEQLLTGRSEITALQAGRSWIVVGDRAGVVRLLRRDSGKVAVSRQAGETQITAVALAPHERQVAVGLKNGNLVLLDAPKATQLQVLQPGDDPLTALAFSADGKLLASGGRDQRLRLWQCENGRLTLLLTTNTHRPIRQLMFVGDRLVMLGEGEQAVRVWHLSRMRARLKKLGIDW